VGLNFTKITESSNRKYIFLNPDQETKETITSLRERALEATKGIGLETIDGTPAKYPFDPHISIIKLDPSEVSLAMEIIGNDFEPIETDAELYEISKQDGGEDGFFHFPIVKEISLGLR